MTSEQRRSGLEGSDPVSQRWLVDPSVMVEEGRFKGNKGYKPSPPSHQRAMSYVIY